jgi:electron transfer flavoprotein alpha subunit
MAEVLVVVEASQASGVKKVTLEMLTIARTLGSPARSCWRPARGASPTSSASTAPRRSTRPRRRDRRLPGGAEGHRRRRAGQAGQPAAVLLGSTQEGKEIAGRLAVKLDNGLLTDAVEVTADGTATQVVFAGSTIVKSKVTKGLPIVTIRPNSVTPARRRPPPRSSS